MTLAFDSRFINEDTAICRQSCRALVTITGKMDSESSPANARQMWSSSITTLRTVRGSCSCRTDFFSTPKTTTSLPRTPTCNVVSGDYARSREWVTAQVPFLTASKAYSTWVNVALLSDQTKPKNTWKRCPSGENTVRASRRASIKFKTTTTQRTTVVWSGHTGCRTGVEWCARRASYSSAIWSWLRNTNWSHRDL